MDRTRMKRFMVMVAVAGLASCLPVATPMSMPFGANDLSGQTWIVRPGEIDPVGKRGANGISENALVHRHLNDLRFLP